MNFLHPVFTILTIVLIIYSFLEVYNNEKYNSLHVIVGIIVVFIGMRAWVGADYPIYYRAYRDFGEGLEFSDVLLAGVSRGVSLEMEWLYVLIGKIIYTMGLPFFIFTFICAIISITFKYITFSNNSVYPALAMALYMFPTLFTSDGGQMRQGLAMGVALLSFKYIKDRKLLPFLFLMYIGIGFHHSIIVFIIVYWVVRIPLNSNKILILILISMILSPLKLYEYVRIFDSFLQSDIYEGFTNYGRADIDISNRFIKLNDLICLFYAYFIITYDKEACEKILYYEYMRNIVVLGICLYFIFRWNEVYSSRLVMNFLIYAPMVLVNIVAAISRDGLKKILHFVLVVYVVFYYFVYAAMQAGRAGYDIRYSNFLWS